MDSVHVYMFERDSLDKIDIEKERHEKSWENSKCQRADIDTDILLKCEVQETLTVISQKVREFMKLLPVCLC